MIVERWAMHMIAWAKRDEPAPQPANRLCGGFVPVPAMYGYKMLLLLLAMQQ